MQQYDCERRWLVNTNTSKIYPYAIDRVTKVVIPSLNIDLGMLLVDKQYIKTGFKTEEEARSYVNGNSRRQRKCK